MADRLARFFSPLRLFNLVMPKDRASRRVARDIPFGDDGRQKLDLYAPRRPDAARLPIILFVYGGSWQDGEREGYGFAGRALAAQGFLVAIPDYRLVPDHPYPAFVEDVAAAFRWLRLHAADHGGDPERIVIVGHSAGAYNAAMVALDPRWLGGDRAVVRGLVGIAGPYDFLPLDDAATIAAFGHVDALEQTQPIHHVCAASPPALLLHGRDDGTVWPKHSVTLARLLSEAGVAGEARIYDRVGHVGIITALARPFRHRAPVLADVVAFARAVTG